jgi:hypothetical protein
MDSKQKLLARTLTITLASASSGAFAAQSYSPFVDRKGLETVYWGDTHLHTAYSTDAGMIGNTLTPDEAYRFARGEEVTSSTGIPARLVRPLDFLVVSDHAENLGLAPMIAESNPRLLSNPWGKDIHDLVKAGKGYEAFRKWGLEAMLPLNDPINDPELTSSIWHRLTDAADRFDNPGYFTAFIGYEWTSTPEGNNLHRVVIFKDDASKANQIIPMSQYESTDPEDLWQWMAQYEKDTGGDILAIPHNGNLSNGLMFDDVRYNGKPMDADYARRRMQWEPLTEVTQIKGDGEAHPSLSPDDEFADYGTWDKANIAGTAATTPDMLPREYARPALKRGLAYESSLGVNPFKFGMIGASDSHTALATTRDDNYFGKFAGNEPRGDRWDHYVIQSISGDESLSTFAYEEVASGLAGVWATQNTREALFDAMQRKEVYSTTGPRMTVRLFAGSGYTVEDLNSPDMARIGYSKGVPMGGDLPAGMKTAPVFMIAATRDPDSANLDRVQVVKGWLDKAGKLHEKIYNVALSDGRSENRKGKVKPVGSTVDVKNATYSNTIGAAELRSLWTDPDFDPALRAVYYVRVLEIPTPAWPAYDQKRFGVNIPDSAPKVVQNRAYTSPIWYTPKGR